MSKKYSFFVAVLFCLFIFGFGIAHFVLADREFSQQENRYLSQFEAPTLSTLKSGEFMEDFEDYIVDQFPLRDGWIKLKAFCEKAVGKQENNGVYLGADGQTLFAQYTAPEDLDTRVGFINQMAANLDVPVYFALIPDKSYVWADRLPANAPLVDDGSTLDRVGDLVSYGVNWIDLRGALSGDDVFYRTDHHWSTMGAFQGYLALATVMSGSATIPNYPATLVSDEFYGTTWSSSGAGWVEPDEMHIWIPETDRVSVTSYATGVPVEGELYVEEKLAAKDKYSMFLGGNQPLCVIENPDGTQGNLLLIRDSYSDSLAPFLAQDYKEVHLFDPRYSMIPITQYVADNDIDQVLVLYSTANFATDTNLFKLTR